MIENMVSAQIFEKNYCTIRHIIITISLSVNTLLPLFETVVESSFLAVISCTVETTLMSPTQTKHLPFMVILSFGKI